MSLKTGLMRGVVSYLAASQVGRARADGPIIGLTAVDPPGANVGPLPRAAGTRLAPEPHVPKHNTACTYAFDATFSRGAEKGTLYGTLGVGSDNVEQGNLPDCTVGASLLALLSVKKFTPQIRGTYDISQTPPAIVLDVALFTGSGAPTTIHSSDRLPALGRRTNAPCHDYVGYQPAADKGKAVFYVPFLEKALAQLLDANPSMKKDPQHHGYEALEDIEPEFVLKAITGKSVARTDRASGGADKKLSAAALKARAESHPVFFGTDTFDAIVKRGKAAGNKWDAKHDKLTTPGGTLTRIETPKGQPLWRVKPKGAPEALLVGEHAYAVYPGAKSDSMLTIANPWNLNYAADGTRLGGTLRVHRSVIDLMASAVVVSSL
ncbi:MAG TPA: hypothetical protein VFH51_09130 [Myxococcota bacterium]|nr:hypothetical protein [Myxococcota bacterium]